MAAKRTHTEKFNDEELEVLIEALESYDDPDEEEEDDDEFDPEFESKADIAERLAEEFKGRLNPNHLLTPGRDFVFLCEFSGHGNGTTEREKVTCPDCKALMHEKYKKKDNPDRCLKLDTARKQMPKPRCVLLRGHKGKHKFEKR